MVGYKIKTVYKFALYTLFTNIHTSIHNHNMHVWLNVYIYTCTKIHVHIYSHKCTCSYLYTYRWAKILLIWKLLKNYKFSNGMLKGFAELIPKGFKLFSSCIKWCSRISITFGLHISSMNTLYELLKSVLLLRLCLSIKWYPSEYKSLSRYVSHMLS